jgi:hypothetical protein
VKGPTPRYPKKRNSNMRHRNPEKDFPSGLSKKILNCGLMKPYPADPTTRKVVEKITLNYFLRVIPTLNPYSDIVSDIPTGNIYGTFILTFYLTISDILSGIYFDILSDILSGIYSDTLSGMYSHILSGVLSGFYFDILSGIFSGILSGICSDIFSDIFSGKCI